jgi:hypothetical protein
MDFFSFSLLMQRDGNLVLYQAGKALWSTGTYGQNCGNSQCVAVFQSDGNLVVYNGSKPLWNSGTNNHPGAQLIFSAATPHIKITNNGSVLW